ncbi:DUF4335 domain-containing protein [Synechococcus sp. PCC 7336]|uniref:DUF4335 domain-containing protein n=1 Tax=Synechococcus sp. PCC 7336 TaxID=195250 RepID=UPI0003452488|nr:DUF4335 domain-containing protein [Synechococcus sp. PCC 7336]
MPTTTSITQNYAHTTCTLSVRGQTEQPDRLSGLVAPVNCELVVQLGETSKTFSGDIELLKDLVSTIEHYLASLLRTEPQGTFSGSVAIRPLDAVRHRITLRQGEGIGQVDLSMTQLYDLAESLGEIKEAIPHLDRLKTPPPTVAWYRQTASIAAIGIAAIGIAVGALVLSGREVTESQTASVREASEQLLELPDRNAATAPTVPESRDRSQSRPESEAVAANGLARQANQSEVSTIATRLQEQLEAEWQSPQDLTEPLVYRVTVDADGNIVAATPEGEVAGDRQAETPLAEFETFTPAEASPAQPVLPEPSSADSVEQDTSAPEAPDALNESLSPVELQVAFGPDNAVTVMDTGTP